MRFGAHVIVSRGGSSTTGCGRAREVSGVLIGARGKERIVRLTQDDPDSTIAEWSEIGDVGRWSACAVREAGR